MISIIIPVGPGHEGILEDALDSVEAQTLRQWECIVVLDLAPIEDAIGRLKKLERLL